ncbi:hypothetical protein BZA77DRAFT_352481 [Pyronema omphalodes]|nr:hypothetical protein BZA77DRAFT_352481 [Pyronema omphalodes]
MASNRAQYQIDLPTTCIVEGCDASPKDLQSHIAKDHIFIFPVRSALNTPSGMVPPQEKSQGNWLPFTARLGRVYNPLKRDEVSMAATVLTSIYKILERICHPDSGQSEFEFRHQQEYYCPIPGCMFSGPHTRLELRDHFYATHTNALNLKCPIQGCNVVFNDRSPDLYHHVVFDHNEKGLEGHNICMQAFQECRNKEIMLKCILGSCQLFRCPFPDCGDLFASYESTVVHITDIHCQDDHDVVTFFNAPEMDCNGTPEDHSRHVLRASPAPKHTAHEEM